MEGFRRASEDRLKTLPDLSGRRLVQQQNEQREAIKIRDVWKEAYNYDFSNFDSILKSNFFDPNVIIRAQQLADVLSQGSPLITKSVITKPDVIVTSSVSGFLMQVEIDSSSTVFMIKLRRRKEDNYLHEFFIARCGTNKLRYRCPNFAISYALLNHTLPCVNNDRVVSISDGLDEGNYLVMESIEHDYAMYDIAVSSSFDRFLLYFIQVLKALIEAEPIKFTHYDLHSDNVLLRKIDSGTVSAYYNGQSVEYVITDYLPVIIDFGMSSIEYEGKMYGVRDSYYASIGIEPKYKPWYDTFKLLCHSIYCAIKHGNNQFVIDALPAFKYFIAVTSVTSMAEQVKFFSKNFYSGVPPFSIDDFFESGSFIASKIGEGYGGHRDYERYLRKKYPQINDWFSSSSDGMKIMNCSASQTCLRTPIPMQRRVRSDDFFYFTERRILPSNYIEICENFSKRMQKEYEELSHNFLSNQEWKRDFKMESLLVKLINETSKTGPIRNDLIKESSDRIKNQLQIFSYAREFVLAKSRFELYKDHWTVLTEMDKSMDILLPHLTKMVQELAKYSPFFEKIVRVIGRYMQITLEDLDRLNNSPYKDEMKKMSKLIKKTLVSIFDDNIEIPNSISVPV